MKKQLSIHDIAEKAGVSIATVSRSINPETRRKVASKTLEKIDKLVWRSGYAPSAGARQIRKTAFQTIGLLFPHEHGVLRSHYYREILAGVSDALFETDYTLKVMLLDPGQRRWEHYNFKTCEGVDGLILSYWRAFFPDRKVFNRLGLPCVVINNVEKDVEAHFSAADHFEGGRLAARFLAEKGHKQIAVFGGSGGAPDAEARRRGFLKGIAEAGLRIPSSRLVDVKFSEQIAYEKIPSFIQKDPDVTAVFCLNDVQAFGILKKLKDLGIKCPGRMAVVGYDDEPRAALSDPPLTTVCPPVYDIAFSGAKALLENLQTGDRKKFLKSKIFPVRLIERASV